MAFAKRSFVGAVALTLAVWLAQIGSVQAVSLDSIVARKKDSVAFAEISLAAATQAELQAALQSAIQSMISEEIGLMIDQEIKDSNLFDNVKGVATGALGEMFSSLKASMGDTCQRFAKMAQSKLDAVDTKLQNIADSDSSPAPGSEVQETYEATNSAAVGDGNPAFLGSSFTEVPVSVSGGSASKPDAALKPTPELSAERIALLQVALRDKHKGFFDTFKKWARKGVRGLKKVGSVVKKGVKSIWNTVKPAVAKGVQSAVARMKQQVPSLIGQACDAAEEKIEHLESKVVPESEGEEEEP